MKKKVKGQKIEVEAAKEPVEPLMALMASSETSPAGTRRNAAATISKTDKYINIENGIIPFQNFNSGSYDKSSNLTPREAVVLCQKAYYNIAIFRNTIDLMTDFSTSQIYFKGGSKKGREFFKALCTKNGTIGSFQNKFFREYYRSGNVFIIRYEGKVKTEDLKKITQAFGALDSNIEEDVNLPVRYVILNPGDIQTPGNLSFADVTYYKLLTDYELERLKNPKTDEDREMFQGLDAETKKLIKQKRSGISILIPLDKTKIVAIFCNKQDYEPFAVPLGFPVLEDINWKMELKKMDAAIVRTMQQVLLLITMGAEPEKGGVNQKHIQAVQEFFQSTSIGKVLVADYTTKAQFVIPDIAAILDPKKYETVNRDILEGLNNVFLGTGSDGEKFANQSIKTKIFIERLKQARQVFIDEFLLPEVKRISKEMGLKNYPTPYFEDIDFKDELEYAKIYTRWLELGALTVQEAIKALETGQLPSEEDSIENQDKFRQAKDKGHYEPIVGGPFSQSKQVEKQAKLQKEANKEFDQQKLAHQQELHEQKLGHNEQNQKVKLSKAKGRPTGSKAPKRTTAIGASDENDEQYSLKKLSEIILASNNLHKAVENAFKEKHKLKQLNDEQVALAGNLAELIIANEEPEDWNDKIKKYLENPVGENLDRTREIDALAAEHNINLFVASLLYASKKED